MQAKQYTVKRANATPVRPDRAQEGKKSTGRSNEWTMDREIRVKALHSKLSGNEDTILKTKQVKEAAYNLPCFENMEAPAIDNEICWWGAPSPEGAWIGEYFEFIRTGKKCLHIRVKAKAKAAPAPRKGKAKAVKATQQALPL